MIYVVLGSLLDPISWLLFGSLGAILRLWMVPLALLPAGWIASVLIQS